MKLKWQKRLKNGSDKVTVFIHITTLNVRQNIYIKNIKSNIAAMFKVIVLTIKIKCMKGTCNPKIWHLHLKFK